jgi:hypothetical protein
MGPMMNDKNGVQDRGSSISSTERGTDDAASSGFPVRVGPNKFPNKYYQKHGASMTL